MNYNIFKETLDQQKEIFYFEINDEFMLIKKSLNMNSLDKNKLITNLH